MGDPALARLRPYAPADLENLTRLLTIARAWSADGAPTPQEVLIRWKRRSVNPETNVVVLPGEDGGLIAYAESSPFKYGSASGSPRMGFSIAVHPQHRRQGLGTALYRNIEDRARSLGFTHLTSPVYTAPGEESHPGALFLERRGFRVHHSYLQMRVDGLSSLEGPRWPAGITHRRIEDVAVDAERWAHMVRVNFGEFSSADMVAAQLAEPGVSPEGYFFAVDERTGQEIGTSRARVDLINGVETGYIGTVGVLPEYRGRGIAEALVRHTLRYLAGLGLDSATLFVETENTLAQRLYEKMGWRYVSRTCHYWKQLEASSSGRTQG